MKNVTLEFLLRVLRAMEDNSYLGWRTDAKYAPVSFYVSCNDVFHWASADAEEITPENIEYLERAIEDASADSDDGPLLFCARLRKMRPRNKTYKHLCQKNWPLFDACGPSRKEDDPRPEKSERSW